MRVITGSQRGRKLMTLEGDSVRPTTDKVKESIFNIIQFDVPDAKVIDLFAGSGQLGIEALSRGAESCVFVDSSSKSIAVVEENLKITDFREKAKTVRSDSLSYLDRVIEEYDIALLDPPYKAGLMEDAIERVAPHISENGVIVCETGSEEVLPENVDGFTSKRYKYGKIALTVYRKGE
ncbi:MAG: 16S rRNA (guanine(966)-N(2))-methyltransferase RsmD [Clostridia bacterium]|nr:16S rRNA (guanine(966)-N(2))-methyltransferase RsmD [Clostridia bacterium]